VPFDREGTLRKAEKLLRQGKLEASIAEYRAVVDEQPSDWNTTNTLGDLYFRAGHVDKAVAEYNKIAEHLGTEGFLPKAAALYKKILKIKPDDENAMWHLATISAKQGLLVAARQYFGAVAEKRRARGDDRGETEIRVRLDELDSSDVESRIAAARTRAQLGDIKTAVARLKSIAVDLQQKNRDADVLRVLSEAQQFDPDDSDLRRLLLQAFASRGDFDAACQFATTGPEFRSLAEELFRQGREDDGLNVLAMAMEADPSEPTVRAELAKRLIARGDDAGAAGVLTPEAAATDPQLLWPFAERLMRDGSIEEGTALLRELLAEDPSRRESIVTLGCKVASENPDGGYACVGLAVELAVAEQQWETAAAALHEYINRVPDSVPALANLVGVCSRGSFERELRDAQAQLADAYLASGAGLEARAVAEELIERDPSESNVERFRKALELLGETEIERVIDDRLGRHAPATAWVDNADVTELAPALVDAETAHAGPGEERRPVPIEQVLRGLRDEAIHDASPETAEQHFKVASAYLDMGLQDEALKALQVAARSVRHRFRAGAMLGKVYQDVGDAASAIEWYGRAVESPAPSPDAHHALLYELASLLESSGEADRALAVLLELQAEAGDYRDVSGRLEQLKKGSSC
jgi:tetratricopeptide (TPR) repeat protein